MKKINVAVIALLILAMVLCLMGCGGSGSKDDYSLTGVWEYSDEANGLGAVYDFKDDGTGTYTMIVGKEEVTYEMKYEVGDGHLLVSFVNNDIFSEDDVFDSEFSFQDENTMLVKDSTGMEMTFVRQ